MAKRKKKRKSQVVFIPLPEIPEDVQIKYRGMYVALIDGEFITASHSALEAEQEALRLRPGTRREDVFVDYILDEFGDYLVL
jgi:hypothetical protein